MKSPIHTTLSLALGALLTVATPGLFAASEVAGSQEIAAIATKASTPDEHSKVARRYLNLAKSLDATAEKLERELRGSDSGPTRAMEQKWPALMSKSGQSRERKERLAMQNRRAAQESYDLARLHSKLAGTTIEQIAARD